MSYIRSYDCTKDLRVLHDMGKTCVKLSLNFNWIWGNEERNYIMNYSVKYREYEQKYPVEFDSR